MPATLNEWPSSARGSKYKWYELFDGKIYKLVKGEDFDCDLESFREDGLLTVREYQDNPVLFTVIMGGREVASFNSPVSAMAWLMYSLNRISDEVN